MKPMPGLCLLLLLLAACKKPDDVLCYSEPATSSVRFRVLDALTGKDLYITGALHKDSLKAWQPCYATPLASRFTQYQQPDGSGAYSFDFLNLPTPSLNGPDSCFSILLQWKTGDVDTVTWRYHNERIEDCDLQILDYVLFNGNGTQKFYDGVFEYYTLRK